MARTLTIAVLLTCLASANARGDSWDFKAGLGPVYGSTFSRAEKDGVGFAAYADVGLTETLSLVLGGGYVSHSVGQGEGYVLAHANLGILYNLDVLVVVPFASLRFGWLLTDFEESGSTSGLGVVVAIGFDYLWTDNFTVGLSAEYHGMLTDAKHFPAYVGFTGRIGFRLPY